MARQASWVKLNDEELAVLGPTGKHDDAAVEAVFERTVWSVITYGYPGKGADVFRFRK